MKKQILKLAKNLSTFTLGEINMLAEFDTSEILEEFVQEKSLIETGDKYQYQKDSSKNNIRLKEVQKSGFNQIGDIKFNEAVEYFLSKHALQNCTPASLKTYQSLCKCHIVPFFNQKIVSKITKYDLNDFVQEKQKELSSRRLNNCVTLLGNMLGKFEQWGFLEKSPYQGILDTQLKKSKQIKILTPEQQKMLLKLAKIKYKKLYPVIFFSLNFCMKKSEILALQKQDFNFKKRLISINKKRYEGSIVDLKWSRLAGFSVEQIVEIKQIINGKDGYLFYDENLAVSTNDKFFRTEFRKILNDLNLEKLYIDELLHSFVFNQIQAGESIESIHLKIGAGSIQSTIDKYGEFVRKRG